MEHVRNPSESVVASVDCVTRSEKIQGQNRYGVRHLQVLLLSTGLLIAYGLRVNLSVAIVVMVDKTSEFQHFEWKESTQGVILSSFFWGYVVSQVPGGLLAQRFGPKILLSVSYFVSMLLTLVTPFASTFGWQYLCGARILQGLSQGFIFPCVHSMLAKWVHPTERGFLGTLTYSGTQIGTVIFLAVSGLLASSSGGWPSIFYISAVLCLLWTIFWFIYGSNSPQQSSIISADERAFLETIPGNESDDTKGPIPWKDILTSKPFLATMIAHSSQNWGFWTLLTLIPSYMKNVLEFDIKSNAFLSALPYLVMWFMSLGMSRLSDFLVNCGYISVGNARKLFNSIGSYIPMICLIALGYVTKEHTTLGVLLLTIGLGLNAGTYVGFMVNHMDLSPNYAGTLMGLTNCMANIMSILGPLFAGFIVTQANDPSLWRIVFFVTSGFLFFGNTIFIFLGQGKIQPWNSKQVEKPIGASTHTIETLDIGDFHKSN